MLQVTVDTVNVSKLTLNLSKCLLSKISTDLSRHRASPSTVSKGDEFYSGLGLDFANRGRDIGESYLSCLLRCSLWSACWLSHHFLNFQVSWLPSVSSMASLSSLRANTWDLQTVDERISTFGRCRSHLLLPAFVFFGGSFSFVFALLPPPYRSHGLASHNTIFLMSHSSLSISHVPFLAVSRHYI